MNSLALLVVIFAAVNCQWVVNHTSVVHQGFGPGRQNVTVVNTTIWQNPGPGYVPVRPGYGPVRPGYEPVRPGYGPVRPQYGRNLTQYGHYAGLVNQTERRNYGNDLVVGNKGPNDVVLFKQMFVKPARWLQSREKIINYPLYPLSNGYRPTITFIQISDHQNKSGGHAIILSGGVGRTNVTIRLYSDRSCGFNFKVLIMGR